MAAKKLTPPEPPPCSSPWAKRVRRAFLRSLPEGDVIKALRALSRLGRVDRETADAALREFNAEVEKTGQTLTGSAMLAQKLMSKVLPASAQNSLEDLFQDSAPELSAILQDLEPASLAIFLAKEEPPQIAVVLAHMESGRAAMCLKLLPDRLKLPVIQRLASLGPVEPGALEDLTEALRELTRRSATHTAKTRGGPAKVAAIVNALDPTSSQELMAALGARDQHLAGAVQELLFQFSDSSRLPDKSLVDVIKAVPMETLKLALKKAPDAVTQALLRNLSERAQAILKDDIAAMGLVRWTEVEKAQKQVADVARRLMDEGKIAGPNDRGEYV